MQPCCQSPLCLPTLPVCNGGVPAWPDSLAMLPSGNYSVQYQFRSGVVSTPYVHVYGTPWTLALPLTPLYTYTLTIYNALGEQIPFTSDDETIHDCLKLSTLVGSSVVAAVDIGCNPCEAIAELQAEVNALENEVDENSAAIELNEQAITAAQQAILDNQDDIANNTASIAANQAAIAANQSAITTNQMAIAAQQTQIDGLLEEQLPMPTIAEPDDGQEITLPYFRGAATLVSFTALTTTGSIRVAIEINGTPVQFGANAYVDVTTAQTTFTATADNAISDTDTIRAILSNNSAAENLSGNIYLDLA